MDEARRAVCLASCLLCKVSAENLPVRFPPPIGHTRGVPVFRTTATSGPEAACPVPEGKADKADIRSALET